jgi:hypothetical protein
MESGLPYKAITRKPLSNSFTPNNPVSGPVYRTEDFFAGAFFFCIVPASAIDVTNTEDSAIAATNVNPLFKPIWPPKKTFNHVYGSKV